MSESITTPPPAPSLDGVWPWDAAGTKIPAMFANEECLDILLPHGPVHRKSNPKTGELRQRIKTKASAQFGLGKASFTEQVEAVLSDPATRNELWQGGGPEKNNLESLGKCLHFWAQLPFRQAPNPNVPVTLDQVIEIIREGEKGQDENEKREGRVYVSATVLVAVTNDPAGGGVLLLHRVAQRWPALLEFLLPKGTDFHAKGWATVKAPRPKYLLPTWQAELQRVERQAADLTRLEDRQAQLEAAQTAAIAEKNMAARSAKLATLAKDMEAWEAERRQVAEEIKGVDAKGNITEEGPASLKDGIEERRYEVLGRIQNLRQTSALAVRLLTLKTKPKRLPEPLAGAVQAWIVDELEQTVDAHDPDLPYLIHTQEERRTKDLINL